MSELRAIIKRFDKGKSPGPDNIMREALKVLDNENLEELFALMNEWWQSGGIPDELARANVASLYKQ